MEAIRNSNRPHHRHLVMRAQGNLSQEERLYLSAWRKAYQVTLYEFRAPPEARLRSRARYLVILNRGWGAFLFGGSHTGVPIQTFPSVLRTSTRNSAMVQQAGAAGQRACRNRAVPRGLRTLAGSCKLISIVGTTPRPSISKEEKVLLLLLLCATASWHLYLKDT